jgi:hypothetical protein
LLIVSGLIALGIGAAGLLTPEVFHTASDIDFGDEVELLNELRAAGGGLVAAGGLILAGAFVARLSFTATLVTALLYLGYGTARVFSMAVDGLPGIGLIGAAVGELAIGAAAAVATRRLAAADEPGLAEGRMHEGAVLAGR